MNLSFSTKFGPNMGLLSGQPTNFVQLILTGMIRNKSNWRDHLNLITELQEYSDVLQKKYNIPIDLSGHNQKSKITTIRKPGRWKVGDKIHFCIFPRSKKHFQFAPIAICKSVNQIEVLYEKGKFQMPSIFINDKKLDLSGNNLKDEIRFSNLVKCEGFNSQTEFFQYFNTSCSMEIISWIDEVDNLFCKEKLNKIPNEVFDLKE